MIWGNFFYTESTIFETLLRRHFVQERLVLESDPSLVPLMWLPNPENDMDPDPGKWITSPDPSLLNACYESLKNIRQRQLGCPGGGPFYFAFAGAVYMYTVYTYTRGLGTYKNS